MKNMRKAISLWNRGHWKDYVFSQGMLLIASLLLIFFISIGLGVGNVLQRFLSSDLPEEQVRVTPLGVQAGFFQTERGGAEITGDILDSLAALPQVDARADAIGERFGLSGTCHVRNIPQSSDKRESVDYYIFWTSIPRAKPKSRL